MKQLNRSIHAMLIDDEIDACKNLSALLQLYWADKINIFGIAQSTSDAERMMGQMQPDVIFIDIEMPGENAFQFLERISPVDFEIIFVTAYDEYALRALKLNAIDYILKPISLEELEGAIKKLEEKILYKEVAKNYFLSENFATLNSQLNGKTDNIHSIVLKNLTRTHVVNFDDVLYLEAQGNYVNFNFRIGEEYISTIMSYSLSNYEEILPSDSFFRIHKSFLVNIIFIKKINKLEPSEVHLISGAVLPISRRRYLELVKFLKLHKAKLNFSI